MRGYHDIGGLPAGRVRKLPETFDGWEAQAEIVRNLLADAGRRMTYVDELRRAYESFGAEKYKALSFYERRVEALLYLLEEKGIVSREELDARIAHITLRERERQRSEPKPRRAR